MEPGILIGAEPPWRIHSCQRPRIGSDHDSQAIRPAGISPSANRSRGFDGYGNCWPGRMLTEQDIYLFKEGTYFRRVREARRPSAKLGRQPGTHFAVWAPNARSGRGHRRFQRLGWRMRILCRRARIPPASGQAFIAGIGPGTLYKYLIVSQHGGYRVEKSDPFAFRCEQPPRTASVVCDLSYRWGDAEWLKRRTQVNALHSRLVHLRGASGLLATRARGTQSLAQLSRTGAAARATTCSTWASRTSSSCPSWSIRSMAPGAIRSPATSRRPRAMAHRRISCTSSTACTSAASA